MTRQLTLLVAAIAGASLTCGPLPDDPELSSAQQQQSIIGGQPARPGEYSPVGAQITKGLMMGSEIGTPVCTGTLIAPDVVLTAAHCTELQALVYYDLGQNIENYFTLSADVSSFGQPSLTLPPSTFEVVEMIAHPSWDISVVNNVTSGLADFSDIALLILATPVTSVAPAVAMESDDSTALVVDAEVEIVGYGQRDADDPYTIGIKYKAVSFINEVGATEMQIGDTPPQDPQKCHGDSGGPSFMRIADGRLPALRVVGVTSHSYDETDCNRGGVDTRVDPYLTWIDQVMRDACSRGVRSSCAGGGGLPTPGGSVVDAGQPQDSAVVQTDAGDPGFDAAGIDAVSVDAAGMDATRLPDATWLTDRGDGEAAPPPPLPPEAKSDCEGCASSAANGASVPSGLITMLALLLARRRRSAH